MEEKLSVVYVMAWQFKSVYKRKAFIAYRMAWQFKSVCGRKAFSILYNGLMIKIQICQWIQFQLQKGAICEEGVNEKNKLNFSTDPLKKRGSYTLNTLTICAIPYHLCVLYHLCCSLPLVLFLSKIFDKDTWMDHFCREFLFLEKISLQAEKCISESCWTGPNLDWNCTFPIKSATKLNSLWWLQIDRKSVITIQIWFNSLRFRNRFPCMWCS